MLNSPIHQFLFRVSVTRFMCIGCAIIIESVVRSAACYHTLWFKSSRKYLGSLEQP